VCVEGFYELLFKWLGSVRFFYLLLFDLFSKDAKKKQIRSDGKDNVTKD